MIEAEVWYPVRSDRSLFCSQGRRSEPVDHGREVRAIERIQCE